MVSPNFRSLIFYIMYHLVRNYNEMFGIHVNTQTVVTFISWYWYVYDVFTHVTVTYHSYHT